VNVEARWPPVATSVPAARRFATEALAGLPEATVDMVALMVSELATNAVIHADTEFDLWIDRTAALVRVEVSDSGGGVAAAHHPAPTEFHGRGLLLVEALADRWGVVRASAGLGKTVWFAVDLASGSLAPLADR
jgi:anti-sigma regulatory factor (Ser/Thr protein kinase)